MYSNRLWDIQTVDTTVKKKKKKIPFRILEFVDTEKAALFPGWENIPIFYFLFIYFLISFCLGGRVVTLLFFLQFLKVI